MSIFPKYVRQEQIHSINRNNRDTLDLLGTLLSFMSLSTSQYYCPREISEFSVQTVSSQDSVAVELQYFLSSLVPGERRSQTTL